MDTSARGKARAHDDDAAAAAAAAAEAAAARFAAVMETKFDFGKEEEEDAGSADELLPLQEHDSDLAFGAGEINF